MNEKIQIDIYKGLPMVMEKINTVALAAVIGKADTWIHAKLRHNVLNGKERYFNEEDLSLINNGLRLLGDEITHSMIVCNPNREDVISQIKELRKTVSMPYIYTECMKVSKRWFESRMAKRSKEGKACSFKEDDILKINMAAMQIANELKSIEFVLK